MPIKQGATTLDLGVKNMLISPFTSI